MVYTYFRTLLSSMCLYTIITINLSLIFRYRYSMLTVQLSQMARTILLCRYCIILTTQLLQGTKIVNAHPWRSKFVLGHPQPTIIPLSSVHFQILPYDIQVTTEIGLHKSVINNISCYFTEQEIGIDMLFL